MASVIKKYAEASILSFSSVISKIFILLVNIALARIVTADLYGIYSLVRSSVNMVETMLSASIQPIVIARLAAESGDRARKLREIAIRFAGLTFLVSVAACAFANYSTLPFVLGPAAFELIALGSTMIFFVGVSGIFGSIFISMNRSIVLMRSSLIAFFLTVGPAFYWIIKFQVVGALLALLLFFFIDVVIRMGLLKSLIARAIQETSEARTLQTPEGSRGNGSIIQSIGAACVNAAAFWYVRLDLATAKNGLSELANLDVAFQMVVLQMLLINSLASVSMRNHSRTLLNGGSHRPVFIFLHEATLFSTGLFAATYWLAPYLIEIYGGDFNAVYLENLSFLLPGYGLALYFNRLFVIWQKYHILLLVSSISTVVMIFSYHHGGGNGLAASWSYVNYYLASILVYTAVLIFGVKLNEKR